MSAADGKTEVTTQRIFELYVDQLEGDVHAMDDALLIRLRWFGENVDHAMSRLSDDPSAAYEVIQKLSSIVQDLDARAGASDATHGALSAARRWALLLPETRVHE